MLSNKPIGSWVWVQVRPVVSSIDGSGTGAWEMDSGGRSGSGRGECELLKAQEHPFIMPLGPGDVTGPSRSFCG